ncbi:TIGR03086 family metal-binding protein [Kineococcus sp. NUM-3379]
MTVPTVPTTASVPARSSLPDPRPLLARASDEVERFLAAVRAEDLDLPTPCAGYDVRGLLAHLVAVQGRLAHVARGGHFADTPLQVGGVADDGWAGAWTAARAGAEDAWADDAVLTRVLRLPWGAHPGAAAGLAYVQELTTHAGDLAAALGRTGELDDHLAAGVLEGARRFLPAEPRGGQVPFGPVVDVPDTAPAWARLAGWTGRTPAV